MLKLFREILRTGEATVGYPFQPVELADGFRGRPQHDPALCIACAACAIACPPNALRVEPDPERGVQVWSLFTGRCIYCARCEEVCPTGAIKLSPNFEMAVMNKADLFESAEYRLAACSVCGTYFAPVKEIEYARALLEQSGLPAAEMERHRALFGVCPVCRRKHDVPKLAGAYREEV